MQARVVIRGEGDRLRSSMSFSISACVHGGVLCWLALYSVVRPAAPAQSAYDLEIRPYEKRIIWYDLREKLPDVSSGKPRKDPRPLLARVKFPQNIVAGEKDLPAPPQLIRMAAPRIDLAKVLQLPNVLAVAPPPRPVRPFQPPPPPAPKPVSAPPDLPDAPRLATDVPGRATPFDAASPKPQPRAFTAPPPVQRAAEAPPVLPPAPELQAAAPAMVAPKIPHGFTAPRTQQATAAAPEEAPPAPAMTAPVPAAATLAIVGLNPVKGPDVPPPPGSHDAGFSAGPEVHPKGSSEAPEGSAAVAVPGLVARGGGKDNPGSLLSVFAPLSRQQAAPDVAPAARVATPPPARALEPHATHVTSAPGGRLSGRYVYTVAIQMPNVTSYSGSWIVWFADRDPVTGTVPADIRPPLAVHKVDPKYIQTAVEERVEGVVRLAAVIRSDGRVQSVELLRHLDDRLDRSAQEALSKWVFEPARRDGVPVEVDAVFEIPFRLAPKPSR